MPHFPETQPFSVYLFIIYIIIYILYFIYYFISVAPPPSPVRIRQFTSWHRRCSLNFVIISNLEWNKTPYRRLTGRNSPWESSKWKLANGKCSSKVPKEWVSTGTIWGSLVFGMPERRNPGRKGNNKSLERKGVNKKGTTRRADCIRSKSFRRSGNAKSPKIDGPRREKAKKRKASDVFRKSEESVQLSDLKSETSFRFYNDLLKCILTSSSQRKVKN